MSTDNAQCSFEYLLGFELFHDQYGPGQVVSIDDEQDTCQIGFDNAVCIELFCTQLSELDRPWRVDIKSLHARLTLYRQEIADLDLRLAALAVTASALQEELRWLKIQRILNIPDEFAILIAWTHKDAVH